MSIEHVLAMPKSREEITRIQSERKRVALARAKKARWYQGKLDHIDAEKLDDPNEWQKIPILNKDILRQLDHQKFLEQFSCIAPGEIAEYWRSGGSTGRPVFYPRTHEDVRYALLSWGRSLPCMGIGPGDLCHIAFPIGVHPAGQVWARSAQLFGVGMTWVGAGNSCPSEVQLDLIRTLQPTVFLGMSSFALHLANLADAKGIDLTASSVKKVVCSAETLSDAKRQKIGRMWGAEVYDVFGMSEAGLMGAENAAHDGIHVWTDMYYVEAVDPDTGRPVPAGETGTLCVTPLWTNHATPFLRWNSGDIVRLIDRSKGSGPWADLFPMVKHAHRTTGFFKIKGVNVNHAEFEDLMFKQPPINDFQAILQTDPATGLEMIRVLIEIKRGHNDDDVSHTIADTIKQTFEVASLVEALPLGTLAAEFERSMKAPRFVDKRS
jgi:phenylacetate-CoA ligase